MKIASLLRLHDSQTSALGLPDSLGDAYLCERNAWYRAIRTLALRDGYVFEREQSRASVHACLPLLGLEAILDDRSVPFHDNVSGLRSLVDAGRDFDAPLAFFVGDFRRNHVLHEACHGVAHQALCGAERQRLLARREPRAFFISCLLGEAFANAVEFFALAWSPEPTGALLLTLNSYRAYCRDDLARARLAVAALGLREAFELALCAHLAAHLWATETTPPPCVLDALHTAAASRGCRESAGLAVDGLAQAAFALEVGFRATTTPAYFSYLGLERTLSDDIARAVSLAEAFAPWSDDSPTGRLMVQLFNAITLPPIEVKCAG